MHTVPAIIVYDRGKLELSPAICPAPTAYRLKEGVSPQDAIVAILILPVDEEAQGIATKTTMERLRAHC